MARVVLTNDLSKQFAGGKAEFDLAASNVRQLIKKLDEKFPGLGGALSENMSIAIDGEIIADPLLEPLEEDSEVFFVPAIKGG
jgi:molybdopterin converting factor small subunit